MELNAPLTEEQECYALTDMVKVAWVPKVESLTEKAVMSRGGYFIESGREFSEQQGGKIADRLNLESKGTLGGYIVVYP